MHLSVQTHDGGDFWGGVPHAQRRRRKGTRGARAGHDAFVVERIDVHESLKQGIALVTTSFGQAVTEILVESERVCSELESFFDQTAPGWEFLVRSRAAVDSGGPAVDLVALARNAQDFYPKETGRVYVRAAIYLSADAAALAKDGAFPPLCPTWPFLARHQMLLTACLIASENLKVSEASTEAVAQAIWSHWVDFVKDVGSDSPDTVDRLVEDAYLKGAADESECEDDDDEPEIWRPRKVIGDGYS